MDIKFILPDISKTGGLRVILEYSNHLIERGHTVSVVYPLIPKNLGLKWYSYNNITKKALRMAVNLKQGNKIDWFDTKANLIRIPTLNEKYIPDADIIVATWWETAYFVNNCSQSKGKKFYMIQGYEIWGGPEDKVHKTYEFNMQKIVIAKWLYEKLTELGVPSSKMKYIPNGIDLNKFKLINDIENRPERVAMLYNPDEHKGAADGISALEIVKREHPALKAVLFGFWPRPETLPEWIEYIRDPSLDELVNNIYNNSSIYLCPSWSEGWHLPPAEAMACGCAVISTDIGGVKDYAVNGKMALLSPVKNPDLLAKNILNLLNDKKLRLKLANAGYNNIQSFNWIKATDELEKLFYKK